MPKEQANRLGMVMSVRKRFTIAEVNAGVALLAGVPGKKIRLVDAFAIAEGGAVGAVTTVDILGTQAAASVKLVAFAQANLTEDAHVAGSDETILAAGASFAQNDANTGLTVDITGSDVTTATHVQVIAQYAVED